MIRIFYRQYADTAAVCRRIFCSNDTGRCQKNSHIVNNPPIKRNRLISCPFRGILKHVKSVLPYNKRFYERRLESPWKVFCNLFGVSSPFLRRCSICSATANRRRSCRWSLPSQRKITTDEKTVYYMNPFPDSYSIHLDTNNLYTICEQIQIFKQFFEKVFLYFYSAYGMIYAR